MTASEKITAHLTTIPEWQAAIIIHLRHLVRSADPRITEAWKWNNPAWEHHGLICGVFTAKDWVHFTFHQGALLDDPHHTLNDGLDNKSNRYIKLREGETVGDQAFQDLVRQAVENNIAGKKIVHKPEPQHEIVLAPFIREALRDNGLEQAFADRPYYQRKHWPEWIEAAKQDTTRLRRLDTMLSELRTGEYMAPKYTQPDGSGNKRVQ